MDNIQQRAYESGNGIDDRYSEIDKELRYRTGERGEEEPKEPASDTECE